MLEHPPPSSLLLSHHPPEAYDRCVVVAGHAVCRRCLALYPATLLVLLLQQTPAALPSVADPWLYLLALPASLDFSLERLGLTRYRPARVVLSAMLLAIPLGRGFSRYLRDPLDPWFWGLVGLFGVPAFAAAIWRGIRDHRRSSREGRDPPGEG